MAKANKRPKNKKLRAKQRKDSVRQEAISLQTDKAIINRLTQALQIHLQGDHKQAQAICNQVLISYPDQPDALDLLGIISNKLGNFEEAIKYHRKAINSNPEKGFYYSNLGASLKKLDKPAEALEAYEKALEIGPINEQVYFNMAIALRALGRLDEAIACYEKVLEVNPEHAGANYNLGNVLSDAGETEKALAHQEKVQNIAPQHAKAKYNKSLLNLRLGNLKEGFKDYEYRWLQGDAHSFPKGLENTPIWDGSDLNGGTLLIYGEQGLGDIIQFIRYISIVKAEKSVGRICVRCHQPLYSLLESIEEIDELVAPNTLPEFDAFIPILSLPHIMGTELDTIPANTPYLSAPPDKTKKWAEKTSQGKLKIGIVWAGNAGHKNDHNRSCPLALFESLMDLPETVFYSLQKGRGEEELAQAITRHKNLIDLGIKINDFADTAAIMENLDIVISVDTSPVHLAGALNKKVWTLLPFVADWRWLSDRDDCPWYPSMKLFRQAKVNDWPDVFRRIKEELVEILNAKGMNIKIQDKNSEIPQQLHKAVILNNEGKSEEAENICKKVISISPETADAYGVLGIIFYDRELFEEAIENYKKAIEINGKKADYHTNLGAALEKLERFDESVKAHEKAIELDPNQSKYYYNLAMALRGDDRWEDSIEILRKSIELDPAHVDSLFSLGNNLNKLGHYDEALKFLNKAHKIAPEDQRVLYNRSFIYLLKGELRDGFRDYEARFEQGDDFLYMPDFTKDKPLWDGSDLNGKTILLHAEQGFGDMIQFIRYIPELKKMGARIIVESHEPLQDFLQQIDAIDTLLRKGVVIPKFDYHAPILSMPYFFDTDLDTIPNETPYMHAYPEKIAQWQEHLNIDGLKVGFIWAGREVHKNDHNRSCKLADFEQLMDIPNVTFFSLQKGRCEDEIAELAKQHKNVIDLGSKIEDFTDSAAIIEQLDLVISVDTAVVHMAGALNKPVWTLLPFVPDWRWMLEREDSPWYPSMRLFRQPKIKDWDSVFALIKNELEKLDGNPKDIKLVTKSDNNPTMYNAQNPEVILRTAERLKDKQQYLKAKDLLEEGNKKYPENIEIILQLGLMNEKINEVKKARDYYILALKIDPENISAHCMLAVAELTLGNWKKGFDEHEWRIKYLQQQNNLPEEQIQAISEMMWNGEDLAGQTLFLTKEQGFGDVIQFIRYAKEAKKRGANIVAQVQPELYELIKSMDGIDNLIRVGEEKPPFDKFCPMMSLPHKLGTTLKNIPTDVPYLKAPQERIAKWQELMQKGPKKIGILWAGSLVYKNDERACSLKNFLEIINSVKSSDATFYSLQMPPATEELEQHSLPDNFIHLGNKISDFSDTAAILSQLDLMITIDTSVAHLAGAMNVPTWTLLCLTSDWRWLRDKNESVWYPSMKLFRQENLNDWSSVFNIVKSELATFMGNPQNFLPKNNIEEIDANILLQDAIHQIQSGNFLEAEQLCTRVIKCDPNRSDAHNMLSVTLQKQGKNEDALEHMKKAVDLDPNNEPLSTNLGMMYKAMGNHKLSITPFKKSIELAPDKIVLYLHLCNALFEANENEDVKIYAAKGLEVDPTNYDLIIMSANAVSRLGDAASAIEFYNRALKIKPDDDRNIYNRSLSHLLLGNLEEGFKEYDKRWGNIQDLDLPKMAKEKPFWNGEDISDKTIFLHTEQGFGDAIQFIRFIPEVKKYTDKIIIGCKKETIDLFRPILPEAIWVAEGSPVPEFDLHLPVMSLPRIFGTKLETIPQNIPYINAVDEKIKNWKPQINPDTFNVGIVWSGNPRFPDNKNRSCPLEQFETILDIPGITFYSLQKGSQEKELADLISHRDNVKDMGNQVEDFADTAAILSQLDLFISTDTSVPHLAGAMGVKTWLLASYVPDWRWLLNRSDSPWYPSLKLFRQPEPHDWETPLTMIKNDLKKLVK
jgi:tetratricopeptide (TPR) repeat protein